MDPKMDSGFLARGEALEDDYDVMRELLPEEVLAIMDQLLCYELAWHQGYPLSQTVFTSHYIDKIINSAGRNIADAHFKPVVKDVETTKNLLVDFALHAYCLGLIKCCDLVIQKVTSTHFYEEEDFSTHLYGRDLLPDLDRLDIQKYIQSASQWAEEQRKVNGNPILWTGIRDRLNFRGLILGAMSMEEDPSTSAGDWDCVSSYVPIMKESHPLGKNVADSFSPKIQRRLASTVPPRPIVELSFEDASTKLEALCRDCREAVRIINLQPDSAEQLKALLWSFSSRKPEPLPYARACVSAPILGCDDLGFEQLLRTDLAELVFPADSILDPRNWTFDPPRNPNVSPDPRFEIANTISNFTESVVRMMGGYLDFFRALSSNRCRLRRNLTHIAIGLENAQQELVGQLDPILLARSPDTIHQPLSTWVYHQKLRIMEWIILLGFELDIYLPDELAGMYWYLTDLCKHRNAVLSQLHQHLTTRHKHLKSRKQHARQAAEVQRSLDFVTCLWYELRGTTALANALFQLYSGLAYLDVIPRPAKGSKYANPHLQLEIRFKAFLAINDPKLPTFEDFENAISPYGPPEKPADTLLDTVMTFSVGVDDGVKIAKSEFTALKKMGKEKALCIGVEDWEKVWCSFSVPFREC